MKLENYNNYEEILSELKNELLQNINKYYSGSIQLSESDPLLKILEIFAYRALMIKQKIQDTYNASILSQAKGNDLKRLSKFLFEEEDNISNDKEIIDKIDNLWKNNTYYTTGTQSSYKFYAYKFTPNVKDIFINIEDEQIIIYLLFNNDQNEKEQSAVLKNTEEKLNDHSIRRITDKIKVKLAKIIEYNIQLTISSTLYNYSELIKNTILENIRKKANQLFLISKNIPLIELTKAAYQPGIISYSILIEYKIEDKIIKINENEIVVKIGEAFKLNNINIVFDNVG